MKSETKQLMMVVGLYLAIILLLVAIIVMVKNVKEIKTDPILYGIDQKDFVVCSCYDKQGNSYDYGAAGIIPNQRYGYNIELLQ